MTSRYSFLAVAVMSIGTVAIGLRVGAGDAMRAAIVMGAPLPRDGGRAAWQVRTQEDDGHTRSAISTAIHATIHTHGKEHVINTATNLDGAAEISFDDPDLKTGDAIEIDLRDDHGVLLARGPAQWQNVSPSTFDDATLRPTKLDGKIKLSVSILGGALTPGEEGRVWVRTNSSSSSVDVTATPDLGIEIASPYHASRDAQCAHDGSFRFIARGLSGGVALHAKDGDGQIGDFYGMVPVTPGAMFLVAPSVVEPGPVHVTITSAGARTLAYVEVDDDHGRVNAQTVALNGEPPRGDATLDIRTPGKNFIVVSGEPTGAEAMTGATRAFPIWIGVANAPCEGTLARSVGIAFPRFVALDGFVEKRAALKARRKKGRTIALLGLLLGSILETILLMRAAREGRRQLERVQNAIISSGKSAPLSPSRGRTLFDGLVVLLSSLLGFVFLFALVAWLSQ